ncbi:MAG: DNA-directed RNA polymerase [Candidatus Aenigmarchaeota archaeon]|nr:DNA-directed RNA polymerase [Candidatus Aenigmarchaeota archaeon]MCK5321721.1 DNA-directed RNA polymerase [Candidatus Aenigmarchaeota archaeon]
MFRIIEFSDKVRVNPEYLSKDTKKSIQMSLAKKYENKIMKDIGVVMSIIDINNIGESEIKVADPGVYYYADFKALAYTPMLHEIVEGEVVDITNFGVFVRFGPIDGLCHISQVIDDYISFDEKSKVLNAKDSTKKLKVGDQVRARIIAISLDKKEVNKINLTMRQPELGALAWIEDDRTQKEKAAKKETASTKSGKK